MRTVKRVSVKLNKNKFERIERIARAFADDKQAHLDFYQNGLNFSAARNYRERRRRLKQTDYHALRPLSVHASDLAVKEAFETEGKYWAAIAAGIHPNIGSRLWTNEQKHYAFWLLHDEHRFAALIVDKAPINEQIDLRLAERKQVQNYLRRRARRMMNARPRVKIARSFVLDNSLYSVNETPTGQYISISSLEKGLRILAPLKGEGAIKGNIRVVLVPETQQIEVHVTFDLAPPINLSDEVVAVDAGLTEVFVDDRGGCYGTEQDTTLKKASRRLNDKGKKRNKLHGLAKKYDGQGKKAKARNIRRRNLGNKKQRELKRRTKITITNQINRAINAMLKERQPKIVIVEKLDIRGQAKSRDMSRRVSYWHRSTLKERFEFKASAKGFRREQINPAYTSQMCPICGYLDQANRKGDTFQCLQCGHAGHADQIAATNQKSRYFDSRITLSTPKETVKVILLDDYNARLEHRNASFSDEMIRTMTVPGQTLERDQGRAKSSRQSKNETATGKSTKSVAIK
ncbi:MAG: zinc ribbon domain-containing protein [Blastocatellia bacterium]